MSRTEGPAVSHGDLINADGVAEAATRAPFTYTDGATQVFTHDGRTTYVQKGSQSSREGGADDQGRFQSFWPPTYRATYDVSRVTGTDGDVASRELRGDVRGTVHLRVRLIPGMRPTLALFLREISVEAVSVVFPE